MINEIFDVTLAELSHWIRNAASCGEVHPEPITDLVQRATCLLEINDLSFITQNRNENSVKKTKADSNNLYRFTKTINETRKLEDMPLIELNNIFAHIFCHNT